MSLKESIAADIDGVFLNPDDFGELHTLDGREVLCVPDTDSRKFRPSQDFEGSQAAEMRLFVKAADLRGKPRTGGTLRYDGQFFVVRNVNDTMGVLEIYLDVKQGVL